MKGARHVPASIPRSILDLRRHHGGHHRIHQRGDRPRRRCGRSISQVGADRSSRQSSNHDHPLGRDRTPSSPHAVSHACSARTAAGSIGPPLGALVTNELRRISRWATHRTNGGSGRTAPSSKAPLGAVQTWARRASTLRGRRSGANPPRLAWRPAAARTRTPSRRRHAALPTSARPGR